MELTTSFQKIATGSNVTYGGATGHLELYAKYNSQDIANNRSNVTVELRLVVSGGYIGNYQATYWSISGNLSNSGNLGSGSYTSRTIGSATGNITHETDGTKTVSFSGSFNPTAWGYSMSVSGSATLPSLHKAPTLNSISFVENSSVLQNIGLSSTDFVPYLSNKVATISATPYDNATITQYKIINGTTSFTSSTNSVNLNFTINDIEMAYYYETAVSRDIPQLIIELTDSMGGVSSYNYTNTAYIMYAKPNLVQTSSSVKRNGQLTGKVIMNLVGTYYNGTIGTSSNNVTLSYKYWKTNESEPSTYYSISSATTTGSVVKVENWDVAKNGTQITDVDGDYAYYFKVKMVDAFLKESYITLNVPVGEYIRALMKDRIDFKKITINGDEVVANKNVGDYAKLKLTTRYTASQTAWEETDTNFTNGTLTTNNSNAFEKVQTGIKCKFAGVVIVSKVLSTSSSNELDLKENGGSTVDFINTSGKNIYTSYPLEVTNGTIIDLKFNSGATSFTMYEGTQISAIRIK